MTIHGPQIIKFLSVLDCYVTGWYPNVLHWAWRNKKVCDACSTTVTYFSVL